MDEDYTPLIDREREHIARIHNELTEPARERISAITEAKLSRYGIDLIRFLIKRVGETPFQQYLITSENGEIVGINYKEFVMGADTLYVLTYVEMGVGKYHIDKTRLNRKSTDGEISENPERYPPTNGTKKIINEIENVLVTEGILWTLNRLGRGGVIEFSPLESDGMKHLDEDLQEFTESQLWGPALRGYNAAFDRYLSGDFDEHIPKKLYFSIEEVLKIICVDEEGWTDNRDLPHSKYLELLKEHSVYDAHGITATELDDLLQTMQRLVAKVSDDRKQRHAYHDRTYATLMIHQVGAYLYFLINRYEQFSN